MTISIDQQIKAAQREVNMRKRVYPRWQENGRMSKAEAEHQIAAMEAIVETLIRVKDITPGTQAALL